MLFLCMSVVLEREPPLPCALPSCNLCEINPVVLCSCVAVAFGMEPIISYAYFYWKCY